MLIRTSCSGDAISLSVERVRHIMDKTYARPDGGTGSPGYFTADTMTGIKAIDNGQQSTDGSIYKQGSTIVNLSGQRIGKMHKGINIVNGRKVAF